MTDAMQVHRPNAVDDVLELLATHGEDAQILAGGTAFTLFHKLGLLTPEHVIATRGLAELQGVRMDGPDVVLGAMTRLRDVELDPIVRRELPVLAGTLALVANLRIRNAATVGGNLAEGDPSSDPPAVLVALDARATLRRRGSERTVPLTELFVSFLETTIADDELMVDVRVPDPGVCGHGSYVKFLSRHAEDRTCLGAAAFIAEDASGACTSLRLCVIGSDPAPLRRPDIEQSMIGRHLDDAAFRDVAMQYADAARPVTDHRGSADYRRSVMVPLVVEALQRAKAGDDTAVIW